MNAHYSARLYFDFQFRFSTKIQLHKIENSRAESRDVKQIIIWMALEW